MSTENPGSYNPKWMINKLLITTLGVIPVVNGHSQLIQKSDDRPNIVILLIDDLGWENVGFMGQ